VLGDFREREAGCKEMDLETALKETVGYQMGTLISCVPGRLGYFEDETVASSWNAQAVIRVRLAVPPGANRRQFLTRQCGGSAL